MFDINLALAQTTRLLAERQKTKSLSYVLYYSNQNNRYDGKISGFTIKQLINEFRSTKGTYKYAFITKLNDDKVLRFYNSSVSKKFFSATRTGRKSKVTK